MTARPVSPQHMRQVYRTFWFFREVRRYEANCIVSGPAEVRAKFAKDAIAIAHHYQAS